MTRTYHTPGGAGSPTVAFGRTEFKGTILHEFGTQAAIGRGTDILEKDTNEFIANGLSTSRGLHGLLGLKTKC